MATINPKEEVLKVYPDAYCDEFIRLETLFRVKINNKYVCDWVYTEGEAWQNAYNHILNQKQ